MTEYQRSRLPSTALVALTQMIVEWCSDHGQIESAFSTPNPSHYVFISDLFDFLCSLEIKGVTQEQVSTWFNARQEMNDDRLQAEKKGITDV